MVLVSHDFRLIDQVAKDIWVCEKQVRLCLRTTCAQHLEAAACMLL